ncbi:RAMP superfamily CRISPR-associated protein [Desulfobacterales bacterium HSG17]|nr:RAMP superfamily CRISPR-associated protein [Desulfobacterales bacterium HSG17]
MLKKMINNARINMEIIPIDPLLIKSGQATVGGVDMSFVRTYKYGEKEEPYIPGSSLKGMIRAYGEKICRSLRNHPVPVCLPYVSPGKETQGEKHQASCGLCLDKYKKKYKQDTIPSATIYSLSCPICRIFGSHEFIGRCSASDAYLTESFKATGAHALEIRNGVAIDRFTGGAAPGAIYDLEVLTRGEFSTSIEIRNFERWQLGLLCLIFRDMEQGLVRIGFGKSRGLGRFEARITQFQITSYNTPIKKITGLAGVCTKEECKAYDFFPEKTQSSTSLPVPVLNGLRQEYDITNTWKDVLNQAVEDLVEMIGNVNWPNNLEQFLERGK